MAHALYELGKAWHGRHSVHISSGKLLEGLCHIPKDCLALNHWSSVSYLGQCFAGCPEKHILECFVFYWVYYQGF